MTQLQPDGAVVDTNTQLRGAAQPLRNTLRLNAATSALGGIAAAVLGGPFNTLLDTNSSTWVRLVGVGLTVFAIEVVILAGASIRTLKNCAPLISAADALWVAASITTIAFGWFSVAGAIIVGLVASIVATLSSRQIILARRLTQASLAADVDVLNESPPTEIFHYEAAIEGSPALAWSIVTDHELYGRLAPNLGAVTATAPNGAGLTRTCSSRGGETWHEACTLWRDDEQYDIEVDTTNYPYPLIEVRGSWWVRPTTPTTIGMDFRYRPAPTLRGRIFAVAMQAAFPLVLRRILRGWQTEAVRRSPRPAR